MLLKLKNSNYTRYLVLLWPLNFYPFTTTAVVSYHRTNSSIAVFDSVLGGLSGRCFLKTAPHFCSIIWSLHERTARSVGNITRPPPHVHFSKRQDCLDSTDSQALYLVRLSWERSKAATSTCFQLTTLVLTQTISTGTATAVHVKKHRHRPSCKFLPS